MTLARKLMVVALPLALAVGGCSTLGETDKSMLEKANASAEKASADAQRAVSAAEQAARAAEQAARAAERSAAEARAAGDKADRIFRKGLRK